MKYERTGVILCTEKYEECVAFYSDVLSLPILEVLDDEHSKLTVLSFGKNTYLMVETGGKAIPSGKNLNQNPVWLRFNVKNVEGASQELLEKGINVKIRREIWGTVGDFMDPDGMALPPVSTMRYVFAPKPRTVSFECSSSRTSRIGRLKTSE